MITPRYGFGIWLLNETPFAELDDILPDGTENTSGLCLNDNWRGIDTQLWNIHEGLGMNLQSVKPFTEDYGLWVFDDTGETKKALMLEGIDEVRLVPSSNILATQAYVQQFAQGVDWQKSVLDKDLTAPPGSPTTGDRYIVAIGATGDWAGHDNNIAEWNGTAWEFTTPNESFACGVEDEDTFYIYNGTAWVKMAGIFNHNDLANLQGGQADEYWHLKTAQHTALINFSDNANEQLAQLNSGGSPTFVGGHFTGKLTVDGLIDPTGLVLDPQATTPFTTEKGMWLNSANILNFIVSGLSLYDDMPFYFDEAQEKYLKLNSTLGRFEFNDKVYIPTVFGEEGYFDETLYLGEANTNAGRIYFYGGTTYDKVLKYDDTNLRFDFNDDLKVNGYLLMTAELSCVGADFGGDEITGILNVDAVNGTFSGQLSITGNQKFYDDKKLIFGTDDDVEMFWDSSNSWGNIFATDFWILDSSAWNYYFGMSASGIQSRFNAGAGVGNWSEYWLSKSNTFIDFFYGGGSSGGAAGLKRLGFYGTKDTAKDYRLKLWDEDNDVYFQLGRVSGIWESNADINLIGSVLKVAGTQVVGAQGATVTDAVTQDLTGTDTIDKTKLEADLTSCKTAINAIIDRIQAHGLIV